MENGREFLTAISVATEGAFEEFAPDAGEFLDAHVRRVRAAMDKNGVSGERRDAIAFYEGMLRGVQLQFAKRRITLEKAAAEAGIDIKSGYPKGGN